MRDQKLNDTDREQWIMNDEYLYNWWRYSRQGITRFVRENRKEIDEHITKVLIRGSK